jgi:hypothetical protein
MDGIVIGRSPNSNALLVYNPQNKQFYDPDSYPIDPYHLPTSVYPDIKYNGGLFCYLLCDENPHMEEKYPPGTRIECVNPSTNVLLSGTVMDIPFSPMSPDNPPSEPSFTVLFNNGTTTSIPLQDMAALIPPPLVGPLPDRDSSSSQDSLLAPCLCLNSKITYEHDGQYHKGYLTKHDGCYRVSFKSHVNKQNEDWGIELPNLVMTWADLCVEGILIPGHVSHTFFFPLPPQLPRHLIQLPPLSVQLTFILHVRLPFSRHSLIPTPTVRFGSAAS